MLGVGFERPLEVFASAVEQPSPKGRLSAPGRERRNLDRSLHVGEQQVGRAQSAYVVAPVPRERVEPPHGHQRRTLALHDVADQVLDRLPLRPGTSESQPRGDLGVRVAVVGRKHPRELARDRLVVVLAALADEHVLELAKAWQVTGRALEDRAVPHHRARGVRSREQVQIGEGLVQLSRFGGGLRRLEQLLREPRRPVAASLNAVA